MRLKLFWIMALFVLTIAPLARAAKKNKPPLPGYTIHFDSINTLKDVKFLADTAKKSGAKAVCVVPPAHVWERPDTLLILDSLMRALKGKGLRVIITRIDASYTPDESGNRENVLYEKILVGAGQLPSRRSAGPRHPATVGRAEYEKWMEDETRFYARRYGRWSNVVGFTLGPFSGPFAPQRGGLLDFDLTTQSYEITQYTPYAKRLWHAWLDANIGPVASVNTTYGSNFKSMQDVPLPLNEKDKTFKEGHIAYFDFVRCLNDWVVENYEHCRKIWHQESRRKQTPFIFQMDGFDAQKITEGRPGFLGFNLFDWIQRSDAVGLSLYTNGVYQDFGHRSNQIMGKILQTARDLKKPIFILESGFENSYPSYHPEEWDWAWTVAQPFYPKTYIYEFFKDPFYATAPKDSGRAIDENNKPREEVLQRLDEFFTKVRLVPEFPLPEDGPSIYFLAELDKGRQSAHLSRVYQALFDLLTEIPSRWVLRSQAGKLPKGSLVWSVEGTAPAPLNAAMHQADQMPRDVWFQKVKTAMERLPRPEEKTEQSDSY